MFVAAKGDMKIITSVSQSIEPIVAPFSDALKYLDCRFAENSLRASFL
jgi:hypothetical protein